MENRVERIVQEVGKVIVGKENVIEKVLVAILSKGHILLDDVPGTGKTTLALAFSKALGIEYGRIQFTPDVVPSDIVGFSVYNKENGKLEYKSGVVMTNLLLADEINRTSSKTQSALLEVMEERQATVDGTTHKLPEPFVVIATQNPVGSAGTQLLPHAQLDRFMIRMTMGYPDFASQVNILKDRQGKNPLDEINKVVSGKEIIKMQDDAEKVYISDDILEYVTHLAEATRRHPLVTLGISPRGALAVVRMAKAFAFMMDRDYVKPEDIKEVFADVCNHRIILAPKAKITDTNPQMVLEEIIENTPSPDSI